MQHHNILKQFFLH